MSEILNEALLSEINRLKAINIEGLGASIQRLENSTKEAKNLHHAVNENIVKLGGMIAKVNVPAEIKLTRHLTIGAKDRYFVAFIISSLVFLLIGAAGVIYGVKKESKLEKAEQILNNQSTFIQWMRKEKGGEDLYQKYIKAK
ncbi:hypothetical protein GJU39_22875 [Pedobacter petrophilus]|uniref:Uncharacterized protein n=1 Tax=Pedobacter petrophilus TaxID=1908241 RepID=A0A7K0G527_9SPHI|nr:hypothetical protein [Pedobacter petrophilus]MRX78913.1 hypothetical protein [Pedobacter petrophilus]